MLPRVPCARRTAGARWVDSPHDHRPRPAVRARAHGDGHPAGRGRHDRPRRRAGAGRAPGRPAGARRPGRLRHDGGVADHQRRRAARRARGGAGRRRRPGLVVAGVGTNDTAHSIEQRAGPPSGSASTACWSSPRTTTSPPQAGLLRHFTAVADATDLPVMLYDIPPRSVVPIEVETLVRAAEHPRIVAVKDAKGDLGAVAWTLARTDLAYYSGEDMLNLPLLALGAVGVVSVVGHVVGPRLAELIAAVESGDLVKARADQREPAAGLHRHLPHPGRHPGQGGAARAGPAGRPGPSAAGRRHPRADRAAAHGPRRGRRQPVSHASVIAQPHLDLKAPPPLPDGRPARHGARRARRDRPQHGRAGVRGPAAGHRLRRAVPRGRAARRRPDPARTSGSSSTASTTSTPSSSPTGTRTTSARSPTCCGCARTSRWSGSRFTLALVAAKLREHRHRPDAGRGRRRRRPRGRAVPLRVHLGQPLDPRRARRRRAHPGGDAGAHRRLQDGPAAAGRRPHRPGRLRPARAEGIDLLLADSTNAEVPGFVTSERSIGPVLDDVFARATQRLIVSSFASHVHRIQQVLDCAADAQAQGRLRRPVDGPQHGRRPRPRAAAGRRPG